MWQIFINVQNLRVCLYIYTHTHTHTIHKICNRSLKVFTWTLLFHEDPFKCTKCLSRAQESFGTGYLLYRPYPEASFSWHTRYRRNSFSIIICRLAPQIVTDISRSGAAGFLRTQPGPDREGVAGGNLGLRDILAALQWVRHNIATFGGDPSRVTVMGHDTGAALVNVLLISSAAKGMSEGLIHSALNGRQLRALGALPLGRVTCKHSSLCTFGSNDWHSFFAFGR